MGSFRHCLLYGIIISVTSWNLSLCNPHMSFRSVTERQSPMEPANTANRKETWKRLITERGNHKLTALDVIKLLKAKNLLRDTSVTTTSPSVTNFDPTRLENRLFNHPMMAESAPPSDVQTSLTRDATSQVQSHAANPRSGFDRTVSGDHVQKAMSFQRADPKQVKSSLSQHQVRMSLSHSQISQAPNPTSNNQQQQNQQQEVPSNINPQQQLPSLWQQQQVFQGQEPSPKHHFQQFQQHRLRKPLQPSQHSNHHSRHAQWLEQQQNRNAQQQHHNEHQQHEQKQQRVNHNVHILQQHQFQQKQNQHQQHQPHENIPQMKHQGNQHTAHAPTQQMSQQSGQKFPQQPAQHFPQQPGQQFPQQPAQQFPQQPGQQFPQQPAQQFPQQSGQQFPQQPGQHETKTAGQQQMQHNHVTQQQQAEQLNHHNHQLFNPQQQSFEQQTQKKQDIINQQQVNNNLHQQHTTEGTMPQQHVSTGTVKREKIRLHPQVDSRFIGNAMAHSMRNHATPNLLQQQFQFTSGDQFQAQHFTHPQGSGPIIQQPINSQRTHNSPPSSISVNTVPPVKQTGKQGHVNPTKPAVNLQSPSPLPSPSLHAFVEQPVVAKPVQNEHGLAAQSNAQSFHLHSVIGNEHVNTMPHVQMSFERKSSPMEQGFHQQPQSPGQTAMNVHLSLVQQAANDPTIQTGKGGSHFTMSESVQSSSTNKGSVTPTASQPQTERRTATGFIKASNSVLPDAGTQSKQTAGHTTLPAVLKPVYLNQQVTSPPVATVAGNVNTHDLSILHQMVASSSSKTNNLDPTAITYQAPLGTPIEQTNGQAATNGALQPMSVSQSQPTSHGQHSVSQNTKEIGTLHPVLTRQSNSQHSAWASNTNNQDTGTQLSILNLKANGELTPVFVNQQNSHNNPNLNTNVFSHPSTTVVSSQWQELTSQLSSTGQQGLNTGTSQLSSTGQQGINTGTAGTTTGQIKSQVSHSGASPPQPDPAQALYETMFSSTQSHTNNVESHSTPTGGQVPNGPNPVLSKQSSNGLLIPISLNAQDTSNSNNIASTTEHVSSSSFSQSGQHQSHTLPAVSHSPASTSQHGSSGGQPQTMVHTQTVNRQNNNIGQPQTTGSLFPAFGEPSSNSFGQASSVGTEVNLGGPNNQEHHSLSSSTVNIILRPHSAIDQSTTANLHTNGGGHMATNVQEVQQVMNQNEINNQGLQTANHQVYQSSNNQIQQGGNTQGGMQTIDNPDIQTVNSNGHEIISSQGSQMQNQMVNSNSVQPTAVLNAIIAQNGNNHQTGNQVNNAQTMSSHLNNNQQINGQINQLNINQMSTEHAVNNQLNGNAMNNQQSVNNELNGNQMNTQQVVNNQKNNNEQLNTKQTVHIQFTSNQINSQQAANNQLDTQHTINNQLNSNQQSNTQHILDNQLNNNQMSSQQVVNNQLNSNQMSSQQDMNNQLNNNQMNIQQDMNNNQMNIQQDMNNQLNNNQMSSQQVVNNQLNSNQMSSQQAVDTQLNSNQINTQQAVNNPLNNNQIMNIQQQNNQRIIDSQQLNNNEQINSQQTVNNQQINGNQGVNDHRMVDSQSGRQISAVDAGSGVVTSTQRQTSHSGLINTEIGVQPPKIANTQFTRTQGQTGIRNSNIIGIKRPMDAIAKAKLTANIQRLLNAGFDPEDILEMYRMHRVELG